MVLGLAIGMVASALAWAGSVAVALAYRLVSGVGFSLFGIARHAYFTEYSKVANRGQLVGPVRRACEGWAVRGSNGWRRFGGGIGSASALSGLCPLLCSCPALYHAVHGRSAYGRQTSALSMLSRERKARRGRFWALLGDRAGVLVPAGLATSSLR